MSRFIVKERTVYDVIDTTGVMGQDGFVFMSTNREEAEALADAHENGFPPDKDITPSLNQPRE